MASNLVNPVSIRVGFDDVGGLDDVINDLGESVILPLKNENLFKSSKLLQPPKGVLLYGPPGCGKTMIAKATAREAGIEWLFILILTEGYTFDVLLTSSIAFTVCGCF